MIYANDLHFYERLFVIFRIFMNDFCVNWHTFMNNFGVLFHQNARTIFSNSTMSKIACGGAAGSYNLTIYLSVLVLGSLLLAPITTAATAAKNKSTRGSPTGDSLDCPASGRPGNAFFLSVICGSPAPAAIG